MAPPNQPTANMAEEEVFGQNASIPFNPVLPATLPTCGRFPPSLLFTFVVGPERKEFQFQKEEIRGLMSAMLDILLNGQMREAREGRVEWPDTDVDTFSRFADYVRRGTYHDARPEMIARKYDSGTGPGISTGSRGHNVARENTNPAVLDISDPRALPVQMAGSVSYMKKLTAAGCFETFSKFDARRYYKLLMAFLHTALEPGMREANSKVRQRAWRPEPNTTPEQCFEPVFLLQARVYVLADRYDIPGLRCLSLHRLCARLMWFTAFPERLVDIFALVRFVYANKVEKDPMRRAVSLFMCCIVMHLTENEDFKNLVSTVGEFANDLIKYGLTVPSRAK